MVDRRRRRARKPLAQKVRVRFGVVVGLVTGALWAALEERPERSAAQANALPPPTVVALRDEEAARPARNNAAPTGAFDPMVLGKEPPSTWALPAAQIDPKRATLVEPPASANGPNGSNGRGRLGQVLDDGTRVTLTLDPRLQDVAQSTLERYKVGWGAVVALRPDTGEVLAFAEHAERRPDLSHLPLHAGAPAASIFKIITSAALLEKGGLEPDTSICTHGGHHQLTLYNLKPSERLDTKCETLAQALGSSNNVAFARWADQKLQPLELQAMANRFLFGKRIPFPWAVGVSEARIPTASRLGLARAAAGFEGTTLSPLHAALVAAAVANDGVMMAPYLVAKADKDGQTLFEASPHKLADVLSADTSKKLRGMLEETVTSGTGRKFFEKKGVARLPVRAGGKSGSLSGTDDGTTRYYSWFVAMAPIDKPEVVVAALVVNGAEWTIKGAVPARDVLLAWFDKSGKGIDETPDPADRDPLSDY